MSFHEGGFDTKLTLTKGRARLQSIPRGTIQVQQTLKSAAAVSSSTRTDRAANGRWSCPFNNAQGHCTSNPIPLPGIKLRRTSHSETEQLNFRQPGILHTNSSPPRYPSSLGAASQYDIKSVVLPRPPPFTTLPNTPNACQSPDGCPYNERTCSDSFSFCSFVTTPPVIQING